MEFQIDADKPTVQKIVDAAIPLFATKGVASVSVKELAETAGVNSALISYYFGGKDNLYGYILGQQLKLLDKCLAEIEQTETCPVNKIRRFAKAVTSMHKDNPYLDRLFHSEVLNPTKFFDALVVRAADRLHTFLIVCINEGVSKQLFRQDLQPKFAAIALIKIFNLSFITILVTDENLPDTNLIEDYAAQAIEIYLRGIMENKV